MTSEDTKCSNRRVEPLA